MAHLFIPPCPDHDDYTVLMSLALDGVLDAADQTLLDQHLQACPRCAAQWALWQRVGSALQAEPYAGPPLAFTRTVNDALNGRERRRERRLGIAVLAGGALSVLASLVVGALVLIPTWVLVSPAARQMGSQFVVYARRLLELIWANLSTLPRALLALMPDPLWVALSAVLVALALAVWLRLVFGQAAAPSYITKE